jgi:alpha-methylacyl-CoA racemase
MVAGGAPAYRLYTCADGLAIALGALEPKFWRSVVEALGLPALAADGLDTGGRGARAAALVADRFAARPRAHWITLASERGLPLTAVHGADDAMRDPYYARAMREVPRPGGARGGDALRAPGPFLDFPAPPPAPAPALGEGTARILAEFGASADEVARAGA